MGVIGVGLRVQEHMRDSFCYSQRAPEWTGFPFGDMTLSFFLFHPAEIESSRSILVVRFETFPSLPFLITDVTRTDYDDDGALRRE
jgi:hypothetical protein